MGSERPGQGDAGFRFPQVLAYRWGLCTECGATLRTMHNQTSCIVRVSLNPIKLIRKPKSQDASLDLGCRCPFAGPVRGCMGISHVNKCFRFSSATFHAFSEQGTLSFVHLEGFTQDTSGRAVGFAGATDCRSHTAGVRGQAERCCFELLGTPVSPSPPLLMRDFWVLSSCRI